MKPLSFTCRMDGRASVLRTTVFISEAFNPLNGGPEPQRHQFTAIWDTGASASVITQSVVDSCQLKQIGVTQVSHAHGVKLAEVYLVNIFLPNKVGFSQIRVTKGDLGKSAQVLIGMDIIGNGDFAVTHKDGKTCFSFRCPSIEEIDFVKTVPLVLPQKVGRNDPCPCKSGKKYKKCCGSAQPVS